MRLPTLAARLHGYDPFLTPSRNTIFDTRVATIVKENMKSTSRNEHLWRFVTNHAHVLECIAADPTSRLRDIADSVGVTERTAAHIVNDLEQAGYLSKTRDGRRNHYEVHGELPLRHPRHRHRTVGDLLRFLEPGATDGRS
jgi:CRP-like cAMP-binding protein